MGKRIFNFSNKNSSVRVPFILLPNMTTQVEERKQQKEEINRINRAVVKVNHIPSTQTHFAGVLRVAALCCVCCVCCGSGERGEGRAERGEGSMYHY
jgi:hypothetical protein